MVSLDYERMDDAFLERAGLVLIRMRNEIKLIAIEVGITDERQMDAMVTRFLIGAVAGMLGAYFGKVVPVNEQLVNFTNSIIGMVDQWDDDFCPVCEETHCDCNGGGQ